MKYLVIGDKGQLGKEFVSKISSAGGEVVGVDYEQVNIAKIDTIIPILEDVKPDCVINCAAYNLVDAAEDNPRPCFDTNITGVENLVELCEESSIKLVHFSSDYVFNGIGQTTPYIESDIVYPMNYYGFTKEKGERICASYDKSLVFRLSWVYGEGTQNFIHKVGEWAKASDTLKIASDEISVPTFAGDIVEITLKALQQDLCGLYHATDSGYCTRLEWVKKIFEIMNIKKNIIPTHMKEFKLRATRPNFSAMSNELISKTLDIEIPHWSESLKKFILK